MIKIIFTLLIATSFLVNAKILKHQSIECHTAHLPEGWYTKNSQALDAELAAYLAIASTTDTKTTQSPLVRALIVPHAGYYYSGLCAATAYEQLLEHGQKNTTINRVIILAPAHTRYFTVAALPHYKHYQTPLGSLQVDQNICAALAEHDGFRYHPEAHETEHALEMQLPFIQKTIANCSIVPLILGVQDNDSIKQISAALKPFIDANTLIIATSDFVHYGKSFYYTPFVSEIADNIRELDSMAINAILRQNYADFCTFVEDSRATICGRHPITLLLALLNSNSLGAVQANCTSYYTSCHMQQARTQNNIAINKLYQSLPDATVQSGSVSYAAISFVSKDFITPQLSAYEQQALLALARRTIKNQFATIPLPADLLTPLQTPNLTQACGAFVTLYNPDLSLRGCIGHLSTQEPLYKTIIAMSQAAAFHDARFKPVTQAEVETLKINITILSTPQAITNLNEIVLGKHGIILNKAINNGTMTKSAVFLPKIPIEQGWDLTTTLEHLSVKAGLDAHAWQQDCSLLIFEGFEIKE